MNGQKVVYQGKIIEVVEEEVEIGGNMRTFEFARRAPGSRTIIASRTGKVLLSKEYRREANGYDYRLPGGKVFDTLTEYNDFLSQEPGEARMIEVAEEGARKELAEEVGISEAELEFLYLSKCGATVEWDLYYFVAHVADESLSEQQLEEGEDITVEWVSPSMAKSIALDGSKFSEDRSAAVLLRYLESAGD